MRTILAREADSHPPGRLFTLQFRVPMPLSYEATRPVAQTSAHPWRDVWLPSIFLAAGAIGTFVWIRTNDIQRGGLILFLFVLAASLLPVVAAFVGYGLLYGKQLELPVASFATAAFKVLAILLITDAVVLWVLEYFIWV